MMRKRSSQTRQRSFVSTHSGQSSNAIVPSSHSKQPVSPNNPSKALSRRDRVRCRVAPLGRTSARCRTRVILSHDAMATAAVLCAPQTPSQWIWNAGPRGPRGSEVRWTSITVTPFRSQTTPSTASPRRPSDFQLLHSLPTELLEFTFEYLALGDLLRLRCVDRAVSGDVVRPSTSGSVSYS